MKTLSIIISILILFISGCAGWSAQERTLLAASCLAAYADYQTTSDLLDNGGHENNPVIGKYPSREKLAGIMISSQILTVIIAHYFPRYRSALLGFKTVVNGGLAVHNSNEK